MNRRIDRALVVLCGCALLGAAALAQTSVAPGTEGARAAGGGVEAWPVCVVPQWRPEAGRERVELRGVRATVSIDDRVATTRLSMRMFNPTKVAQEAQILIPVPPSAAIQGFGYGEGDREFSATLLHAGEARATYESIVRSMRDPGLLEFLDESLIRSSVFPIAPGATVEAWVSYVQPLSVHGARLDYVLPRSSSLEQTGVEWTVDLRVRSTIPIVSAYSPTHAIETTRVGAYELAIGLGGEGVAPGPFRLSVLRDTEPMAASLIAYPDVADPEGGYFMLLLGVSDGLGDRPDETIRRQVTVVLDRSGSMAGGKLDQARRAALQVLEGLDAGERFNIVDYNDAVATFSKAPVEKTGQTIADARAYLASLRHEGGTNIHDALLAGVAAAPVEGTLPVVLFLTDGRPTAGVTGEAEIRRAVQAGNVHGERIFTLGVGTDVNAPLLDAIAAGSRASAAYVLPGEDVEVRVSEVFERLRGPVLTGPVLTALDGDGAEDVRRIRDIMPGTLPDIFAGDQLVILGRYHGTEPLRFRLTARSADAEVTATYRFDVDDASPANGYVARLWASRRIASLIDTIRMAGAEHPETPHPQQKELVDEIVRLSLEFGILPEYTACPGTEETARVAGGSVTFDAGRAVPASRGSIEDRAVGDRTGAGGVNQAINLAYQTNQSCLNPGNEYYSSDLTRVRSAAVQQCNRDALFRYDGAWVDGAILNGAFGGADAEGRGVVEITPEREVEFGSEEYFALAARLAREGRADLLAQRGDVFLSIDGQTTRVHGAGADEEPAP